jgi:hypothetical protein
MIKQTTLIMIVLLFLTGSVSAEHPLPTDLTDGNGLMEGIAEWAYTVTQGMFWAALLLGFCIVLYISSSVYSSDRAFGFAGFTGITGSIFLATLGLMTWLVATMFIFTGVISLAVMAMAKRR